MHSYKTYMDLLNRNILFIIDFACDLQYLMAHHLFVH